MVYKFKKEIYDNISGVQTIGVETMTLYFTVAEVGIYEFPPLEVYLYSETSSGVKSYRKTNIILDRFDEDGNPIIVDFNIEHDALEIGTKVEDLTEYNLIKENITIEQTKILLADRQEYNITNSDLVTFGHTRYSSEY